MNPKSHNIKFPDIEPQFIINKKGIKTGVYLDIKSYEKLLEEIEDLYLCNMARIVEETDKESHTLEEVKKQLKKNRKKK